MPEFVDDLHVAGALQASADPAKVTSTLQKAIGQSVDMQQYLDTDGTTIKAKVDANFIATFQAVIAAGLTGATSAARYVGATTSGAPASGTFVTGDWVISKADAKVYVCTAGGTPGTWTTPASGSGQVTTSQQGKHSGLWYAPAYMNNLGGLAPAVGTMSALPIVLPACTLQAIAVRVTTFTAGGLMRLGIYSDDGTGYPGALLLDAGQVSTAANGIIAATISQAVSGLVWLVAVNQTGTGQVQCMGDGLWGLGVANSTNAMITRYTGYTMTGVTAALPANFSTTVTETIAANVVRLMVEAA